MLLSVLLNVSLQIVMFILEALHSCYLWQLKKMGTA